MKKNIILDVDPGVDDSVSMIYSFLSNRLDVKLICVTKGNKDLKQSTLNALFITEKYSKTPVPVVKGAKEPLKKTQIQTLNVHGASGLGSIINVTSVSSKPVNRRGYGASEAILECVRQNKNITYLCNGPATTLAKALKKYPEIATHLHSIVLMSGSIDGKGGGISPYASFNAFSDPDALALVLKCGVPITFSPSEIGLSAYLTPEILQRFGLYGTYGKAIQDLCTGYHDLRLPADKYATHDLCAVMSLSHPELFTVECVQVSVDTSFSIKRGQTLFKKVDDSNVRLIVKADRDKIIETFEKCLIKAK